MLLRRTGNGHIKRQCQYCGHTYRSGFSQHVRDMHFLAAGGVLDVGKAPELPFYGNVSEVPKDVHMLELK